MAYKCSSQTAKLLKEIPFTGKLADISDSSDSSDDEPDYYELPDDDKYQYIYLLSTKEYYRLKGRTEQQKKKTLLMERQKLEERIKHKKAYISLQDKMVDMHKEINGMKQLHSELLMKLVETQKEVVRLRQEYAKLLEANKDLLKPKRLC